MLYQFEEEYPDFARVHLIGQSQQDQMPIYALQLSDDVSGEWQRPALLFVGQVHAEEVLGVEITLSNIQTILQNRDSMPYIQWLYQLDTWWVPTLNPEGHTIVTSNIDTSYRKNKRDTNGNGLFDFSPQIGGDIDGVDINRNFSFNWVHGDTLYQPATNPEDEEYDYYRGPAPMSESEIHAIKTLADQKKFVFSICWHSSRTGDYAERVYYSYNWNDVRPSPDVDIAQSIAQGVADQIVTEIGGNTYAAFPNWSRRGAFHDWMYQEYGTIQLLIEVGTSNLQPQQTLMLNTIERASNGVWWLLNRALVFSMDVASNSMLSGNVSDAVSGLPLAAEIIVEERDAQWFIPRESFAETGRYYRALPTGVYDIRFRRKGYHDALAEDLTIQNSSWTDYDVALSPKATAMAHGYVSSGGQGIPAQMIIKDVPADTLLIDGHYVYHGFEGEYPIEIYSESYYPYLGTIDLEAGPNQLSFNLSPADLLFGEDWEGGTSAWELSGPWVLQDELAMSGHAITDSWGARGFYAQNCDVWIKTAQLIQLPIGTNPLLCFDSRLYTEWDYDPVTVELSTDAENWDELWRSSGCWDFWQKVYVDISSYEGNEVYLRFRLRDQSNSVDLTDPGWTIDNIRIIGGQATANVCASNDLPPVSVLYPNFPNPFNPETTIRFCLAEAGAVSLEIFNVKGQKVRSLFAGCLQWGDHSMLFDGKDLRGSKLSSGMYFLRMKTAGGEQIRKMLLLK
jgi:hypothetical protein